MCFFCGNNFAHTCCCCCIPNSVAASINSLGVRRAVHDCLNPCSVALFALGLRSLTKRVLFQDERPGSKSKKWWAVVAPCQAVLFLLLCGTLLLLIFAFAALHKWQHKGWPRAAVFSFTGIRGLGVLAVAVWEAVVYVNRQTGPPVQRTTTAAIERGIAGGEELDRE